MKQSGIVEHLMPLLGRQRQVVCYEFVAILVYMEPS